MDVAESTAIAFVPTKLGAWLTKGGRQNALDDFCDSVGPMVTRRGKWLRNWWVHPHPACDSAGGAAYQYNRRPTHGGIAKLHTVRPARRPTHPLTRGEIVGRL